jgi:hypothetical protein
MTMVWVEGIGCGSKQHENLQKDIIEVVPMKIFRSQFSIVAARLLKCSQNL